MLFIFSAAAAHQTWGILLFSASYWPAYCAMRLLITRANVITVKHTTTYLKLVSMIVVARPRVPASWSSMKGKSWFVMGISGMHFSMSTGRKITQVSRVRTSGLARQNKRLTVFTGSHWVVGSSRIDNIRNIRSTKVCSYLIFVYFFWLVFLAIVVVFLFNFFVLVGVSSLHCYGFRLLGVGEGGGNFSNLEQCH